MRNAAASSTLYMVDNGGHGDGLRVDPDTEIGKWPSRFADWLMGQRSDSD